MPKLLLFFEWLMLNKFDNSTLYAQYRGLSRQVPLLYALLSVNAAALAYTHLASAPIYLAVWIPGFLVTFSLFRMAVWLRSQSRDLTAEQIKYRLRFTVILAAVLAFVYVLWSLELSSYGGPDERAHVATFIAITVIGCIFCLNYLPQAALGVTVIVTTAYLRHYLILGNPIYVAIALNIGLVSLVVMRVLLNSFAGFTGLVNSRAEMKRLHHKMTILAHTDVLTELPNRLAFFVELTRLSDDHRREGGHLALGMIDLDRFKAVNDTFGHLTGDRLLAAVGHRLRERFSGAGVIARLGGDEFAILMPAPAATAMSIAEELCVRLSEPYRIGDLVLSIGASCGVATLDDSQSHGPSLYERADYALYHSKICMRGLATLYTPQLANNQVSERAIEAALQSCDVDTEMELYLQPIFDVTSGHILSVEALARWTHPELGTVRPDIFIPLAERCGIIHHLTTRLFAKALTCAAQIPSHLRISFNLSAHDVISRETILTLVSAIHNSGVAPKRIVFELTETDIVKDFDLARESLNLLHALGVVIALDDFGTGHSNLGHLHELPIDKIKIDRSFVSGPKADDRRHLLGAVVAFSHSLGLRCVAEGVEDADQLAHLKEIGCDAFQGYYGAKPMSLSDFLHMIAIVEIKGTDEEFRSAS